MRLPGEAEVLALERRIAAVEAATGVQVVAAVLPRCDRYPELKWRAFALGVALAALAVVLLDIGRSQWDSARGALLASLTILGSGAVLGTAAYLFAPVARWFLRAPRARAEVRQRAEVMFLSRELFATPRRNAILVLASLFERRVVVVPDAGFRGKVSTEEWEGVVAAMTPRLAGGAVAPALEAGLDKLQALLESKGMRGPGDAALSDRLVRDEGA
jgi:putative membrane protein